MVRRGECPLYVPPVTKTFRTAAAVVATLGTLGVAQTLGMFEATALAANRTNRTTTNATATTTATVPVQALPHEAVAANGTVWATDPAHDQLLGLGAAGATLRIALHAGSKPVGIVRGPDGLVWFTESGANVIARVEKTGVVTTFAVPTPNAQPWGITAMPGDLLAFTERATGKVGIAKPDGGVVGEIAVGNGTTQPTGIVTGADGSLYFTETASGQVAQYSHEVVTHFSLPSATSQPTEITAGPDGALFVSETATAGVARVTTTGVVTDIALPKGSAPAQLDAGPDRAIWVAQNGTNRIARVSGLLSATSLATPTLSVTQRTVAAPASALVATPDGALVVANATSTTPARVANTVATVTPCAAGPACVGVDARSPLSAMTHVADGYLHSAVSPAPSSDLVTALHPVSWRISGLDEYPMPAAQGATITYLLSDGWYNATYGKSSLNPTGQVPPWSDPAGYTAYIKNTVSSILAGGYRIDYWEVQNEPSKNCCGTADQQLTMYQLAYDAIKSVAPTAKVMGPTLAGFADAPYPTTGVFVNQSNVDLRTFLSFAVAHGEHWDALSWHEISPDFNTALNSDDIPNAVADHVRRARQLLAEFPAAGSPELVVNEYDSPGQSAPGFIVGFDAALEGSGVGIASMACWTETDASGPYSSCTNGAVDGLFLRGGATPTALYWLQKAYADLGGDRVAVTTNDPEVTGVASLDGSNVGLILGKHGGCHPLGKACSSVASTAAPRATVVSVRAPAAGTTYSVSQSLIRPGSLTPTVTTSQVTSDANANLVAYTGTLTDGDAVSVTIQQV